MTSYNQRTITIDAVLYAEMEAYAELHQLPLSDVVARMWALYRDMSTMRETGKIRDTAIAAYQAAHPFVPDGDDTFVHCPSCQRMIAKAYLVTVEDVIRCTYCYTLPDSEGEIIMEKLYAIPFTDGRERGHVAAIRATNPEEAVRLVIAYQEQYDGFYMREPNVSDVVEINPDEDESVQILYHEDYD